MTKTLATQILLLPLLWSVAWAKLDPLVEAEDQRQVDASALVSAAQSHEPKVRARSALAYGRIQSPKSIDRLIPILQDESALVRKSAAFALGQLGWKREFANRREDEIVAKLLATAGDGEIPVRLAAIEAIGKLATPASSHSLIAFLHDGNQLIRAEAAMALFRYRFIIGLKNPNKDPEVLSEDALSALRKLTHDRSETVRRNTAYNFARIRDPRALDILLVMASDKSKWVRFYAVSGLAKIADPKSLPVALKAATEKDIFLRVAAIGLAKNLKSGHLLDLKLQHDSSFQVRCALIQALAEDPASDLDLISKFLYDASSSVRAEALRAVALRKKAGAFDLLNQTLQSPDWVLREAAVSSSSSLGGRQESFLTLAAKDRNAMVRAAVINAYGLLETRTAFDSIVDALDSGELAVRGSAVEAMNGRKEASIPDVAWRAFRRSSEQKWIELRENILDLLAKTPGEKVTSYLHEALDDPAPSVAMKAYRLLLDRGISDISPPAISGLSYSPYRDLRFSTNPVVTLKTNRGLIVIECFPKEAQIHVANFVGLVKHGFYNGLSWHRVVSGFVIQGGDPDGSGWGDAGYNLRAEINSHKFARGTLGMPRSEGFDTGGVQLFITHVFTPHLDGQYTVFGQVIRGLDVVDRIEKNDTILEATVKE